MSREDVIKADVQRLLVNAVLGDDRVWVRVFVGLLASGIAAIPDAHAVSAQWACDQAEILLSELKKRESGK